MTVSLRPMRPEDIAAVEPLEKALFEGDPPWSAAQFREELAGVPDTRWYVVAIDEIDGAVVGYAGLLAPGMAGDPADVQTIAVAPAHQRAGIGAMLMEALLAEAQSRHCGSVLLEVRADNSGALEFYGRYGFERIATRRGYYGGRCDALVLRKRLPSRS